MVVVIEAGGASGGVVLGRTGEGREWGRGGTPVGWL